MSDSRLSLTLTLDYQHGLGDLASYFETLADGRAVGTRCPDCGRVWCPPRSRCPEHLSATEPIELSGVGTVVAVTVTIVALPFAQDAKTHSFVLVALDGADNMAFGRISDDAATVEAGSRVRLTAPREAVPHPAQAAVFTTVVDP
ncbi:MAG: Zn-ribbon domain-containing OB-fold protein [Methyloligellaceae bacterium]